MSGLPVFVGVPGASDSWGTIPALGAAMHAVEDEAPHDVDDVGTVWRLRSYSLDENVQRDMCVSGA